MNFLAHLYLSANDDDIKTGNFIGDSVKGRAFLKYKLKVQQGILLHRKIDRFTDTHLVTKEISMLLKEKYGRYSGIVIDVFYDHFLSINWIKYSNVPLNIFVNSCYKALVKNFLILPAQVRNFLPILIAKNRLLSYLKLDGIENALITMSKYTSLPNESDFALEVIEANYQYINNQFLLFFDEVLEYTNTEIALFEKEKSTLISI
jgi:acyl carrier protein phosphodiesterase